MQPLPPPVDRDHGRPPGGAGPKGQPPPPPEPVATATPEPPPLPLEPVPLPPTDVAEDARMEASFEDTVPNFDDILARAVAPPPVKTVRGRSLVRRFAGVAGWVLFAVVVLGVGGAIYARDVVMDDFPKTKPAYAFFGFDIPPPGDGLRLNTVNSSRTLVDGTPALVIEGKVTNTTGSRRSVPPMRGSLRDAKDQELQSWTFSAANPKLDAGESTTFHTEIKQPSPQATGLSINFLPQQQ